MYNFSHWTNKIGCTIRSRNVIKLLIKCVLFNLFFCCELCLKCVITLRLLIIFVNPNINFLHESKLHKNERIKTNEGAIYTVVVEACKYLFTDYIPVSIVKYSLNSSYESLNSFAVVLCLTGYFADGNQTAF